MANPAVTPQAMSLPARSRKVGGDRGWDLLLLCTSVYIVTAVARIHEMFSALLVLKPTLIFAALGVFVYFSQSKPIRSVRAIDTPVSRLILFIMIWATLGVPFAIVGSFAAKYLLDEAYKVAILFLLVAASVRNLEDVRRLLYVYGGGTALLAFIRVAGRHGGLRLGSGGTYDPNDLAMVLVSAIPVAVYALGRAKQSYVKIGAMMALLVLSIGIVDTASRGGFLAFCAVGIYTLFYLRGIKKAWRVGALVGVAALMVLKGGDAYWGRMQSMFSPNEDYNVDAQTGRIEIWKRGLGYMLTHPIFGVGADNFKAAEGNSDFIVERQERGEGTKWSAAHSAWVQIGAELGIPGIVAFLGIFAVAFRDLRKLSGLAGMPGAPPVVQECGAIAGTLLGIFVGLFVAITFISQAFGYAVYAAFGLLVGLVKILRLHGVDPKQLQRSKGRPVRGRAVPAMVRG